MKKHDPVNNALVRECCERSIQLLKNNSQTSGIIACALSEKAVGRHYASIFGRDAAICSLGMVLSGDKDLIRYAKNSLITLARYQAPNGQIPKFVKPEIKEVDFWYYGCIDATLWWLIAIDFYDSHVSGQPLKRQLNAEVRFAINWLLCQEHQGLFLLQQNEASDWADIMPRSGFVLYSNALWYHVKVLYNMPTAKETKYYFNRIFFPFSREVVEHRRARILMHYIRNVAKKSDFYLSFVNFSFWGEEVDVYGNILSMLFGLASLSMSARMAGGLLKLRVNSPYPVKVVHSPIRKNSHLWRQYMQRFRQNFPYQYHNGGIWPFAGGFWVMLLAKLAKHDLAWEELVKLAGVNRLNDWEFNEWLHGQTGEPMGMAGQSWNAAMFILAYHALHDNIRVF
jgi:glycogen debranching enzyme